MKRLVAVAAAVVYLFSACGTLFAADPQQPVRVSTQIQALAGVTPDSILYGLERAVERWVLAFTWSEERLAGLQAEFAVERASEAALMAAGGKVELSQKAAAEWGAAMALAAEHLQRAIEATGQAVLAAQVLADAQKTSREALQVVLARAPESARAALQQAMANQEKTTAALMGFYSAKQAFVATKRQLEEAKQALGAARKAGDAAATLAAEARVKALEVKQAEVEALEDRAETAKERVKEQLEKAAKSTDKGAVPGQPEGKEKDKEAKPADKEPKAKEIVTSSNVNEKDRKAEEEAKKGKAKKE